MVRANKNQNDNTKHNQKNGLQQNKLQPVMVIFNVSIIVRKMNRVERLDIPTHCRCTQHSS